MLVLNIKESESFDSLKNIFIQHKEIKIVMEHSLVSISKWESKFKKPFLSSIDKTMEELLYYFKCMTITQNIEEQVYMRMTDDNVNEIMKYIEDPMTATIFTKTKSSQKKQILTNEVIYGLMIAYNIDKNYETWHINRLLTLIRVCQANNSKSKKMSRKDQAAQQQRLNAERRAKFNSKG